jgi:hypothetical protein
VGNRDGECFPVPIPVYPSERDFSRLYLRGEKLFHPYSLRASLKTLFSKEFFILSREISLFSFAKIRASLKNGLNEENPRE